MSSERVPQSLPKPGTPRTYREGKGGGEREWAVVDDLPSPFPVSQAEIDILEIYLGGALDDLLRRMKR